MKQFKILYVLVAVILVAVGIYWFWFRGGTLPNIAQGVKGTITLRSGNCMPSTGGSGNTCSYEVYKQKTKVVILSEKEQIVKEVDSVSGEFAAELAPGKYFMKVVYNGVLREGMTTVGFSVEANRVTNYNFTINNALD